MSTANELLMSGGGHFAKFVTPGDTVTGRIISIGEPYQVKEYNQATGRADGPPKFTKAGKPVMAFHITLSTDEHADSEDDGTRVVDVNSWRMQDAIRNACRAAGSMSGLSSGATLTVTYTGDEVPGDPRSGKKYTAAYVSGANSALMADPTPAPVAAAPAAAPAPVAATAPAVTLTPEQAAAFAAFSAQQAAQAS